MSREKVSISLDKDEKSLRTFKLQHMVKAVPLTLWRLTSFFDLCVCIQVLSIKKLSFFWSAVCVVVEYPYYRE